MAERVQARGSRRWGLGARMAVGTGMLVSVAVVGIGLLSVREFRRALIEVEIQEAAANTRFLAEDFANALKELPRDVAFVAATPPIRGIVRATAGGGVDAADGSTLVSWRERLEEIFGALMRAKPDYVQVRYIGAADGGRELVRVDRAAAGEPIATVEDGRLQRKGDRSYFIEAARLSAGEIYLSKMELNEENGRLSVPYLPVVRAAAPVFDAAGAFFGLVVINEDLRPLFARQAARITDRRQLYVADAEGRLLWARGLATDELMREGLRRTLGDVFPGAPVLAAARAGGASVVDTSEGRQVLTAYEVEVDPERPDKNLLFVQAGAEAEITAAALRTFRRTLVIGVGILTVSLLIVVAFSRSLTRPLRQMAESARSFARGEGVGELPTQRKDEVGDLAASFDRMAREVEESLRTLAETERRLAMTLEAGNVGIWSWRLEDNAIEWDATMRRIFGVEQDAVIDDPERSWENIASEDLPRVREAVAAAIEAKRPFHVDYRVIHSNGEVRYVSASGEVSCDEEGRPTKFMGVCHDVTESRAAARLEQHARELARSNAALEEFAHVASHDLQEPLRTVTSYVELLGRRYKGQLDQDADDFIAFAVEGADRMRVLIEDLLEYSRVGSRGRPFEPVSMREVLEEALAGLEVRLEESAARVEVDGELPTVMADAGQLRQLFQNLLTNGIKFCGERPPEIHISAERLGEDWRIAVRDSGIGIEPRFAERIFVIFQRLHGRERYPGTGIGLAVCKRIVERHGGRIWVESSSGEGSTFFFTWPRGPAAAKDPHERQNRIEERRNLAG